MAGVEVPVVPGGSSRSVTYDNRLEYVEAAVAYRLAECDAQVDAIRAGLACMVPVKLLCLFTSYVFGLPVALAAHAHACHLCACVISPWR